MDLCSLRKMKFVSILISSILLLPLVNGGCSFSQEGKDTSGVFKDMDAARCPHLSFRHSNIGRSNFIEKRCDRYYLFAYVRLAAKMALAHQGLDIEAQKSESKR